jgi:hypothetical protein
MGDQIEVRKLKKLPEESRWYYILNMVMGLPGVKVDRDRFLSEKFSKHADAEKTAAVVEKGTGKAGVPVELLDDLAAGVIKSHKMMATGASAAAGLPGGFGLIATVPADLAQYYFHALQVAQKLAYIYGYPDLEKSGKDDFLLSMTLFIGQMNGIGIASSGIQEFSRVLTDPDAGEERLRRMALARGAIYPIVKQIARVLGVGITRDIFARSLSKIIPGIGAIASGGLTLIAFSYEAERLREGLRKDFLLQMKND